MTKKEQVEKNISLAFDFMKKVIKDPTIIEGVEDG